MSSWVLFFCIPTDFLFVLLIIDRRMLKYLYNCGFVCSRPPIYQFLFCYFEMLCLGTKMFGILKLSRWIDSFNYEKNCLFLVILFAVKSALVVMDVVTSASFWLVLTWFLSYLKVGFHSLHQNSLFVSYILWFFRKV